MGFLFTFVFKIFRFMENDIKNEMERVLVKIREARKEKGYSHEVMAYELGISPSSYNKIERKESRLTLERFLHIKTILEKDISDFFEVKANKVFNQDLKDYSVGNVENLHQENREVYEKLIQAKDEQIELLKQMLKIKS